MEWVNERKRLAKSERDSAQKVAKDETRKDSTK